MADFASTNDNGVPVWINLDYVVMINRGLDPKEPTNVYFINGQRIQLSRTDGGKLVAQLNQCCKPRPAEKTPTPQPTPNRIPRTPKGPKPRGK